MNGSRKEFDLHNKIDDVQKYREIKHEMTNLTKNR